MDSTTLAEPGSLLARKALAEACGTFALVFAGCGAIVVDAQTGALGHMGICAVFGLVVAAMIFATGHVSGAHLNPAVTLAFAATGRFPWREVPSYIGSQCGAATGAALAVAVLFGSEAAIGATIPAVEPARAVGIEVVLTAVLMFVITSVASDARAHGQLAAVAIGATVALAALVGGPLTGASMNPARSLGPALASGQVDQLGLYLLAPVAGALVGAVAYGMVACSSAHDEVKGCC